MYVYIEFAYTQRVSVHENASTYVHKLGGVG